MTDKTINLSHIFNKKIREIFLLNTKKTLQKTLNNTEQSNLLKLNIALLSLFIISFLASIILYYIYHIKSAPIGLLSLALIIIVFRNQIINNPHSGAINIGSHILTSFYFVGISLAIPITGGIHSPLMSYYCLCPILADFLFNIKK